MSWTAPILITTVVLVGFLFVFGIRASVPVKERGRWTFQSALLFLVLMFVYLFVGFSGVVKDFNRLPPPFAFFILSLFAVSFLIAFSKFGSILSSGISYSKLVAFHGFRILAELVLYFAFQEGLAPVQMTFEGFNFDILIGGSALLLAYFLREKPNRLVVWIWNTLGTLSLLNIATIAALSMPTPLRYFTNEPSNIWVVGAPYILLPGILVVAALTGHLILFRKLRHN